MLINNAVLTGSFTVNGVNYITNTPSTGSNTFVGTQTISGSTLITGSLGVTGSLSVSGSITTTGTLTAQTLVVQTITSSIDYITGSSINGSLMTNTHQFTGSVLMTGSITQTGTNTTSSFAGLVGINTTTPSYSLDVTGTGRFTGATLFSGSVTTTGNITLNKTAPNIFMRGGYSQDLGFFLNNEPAVYIVDDATATKGMKINISTGAITQLNSGSVSFTGAATFSSSVTATSGLFSTTVNIGNATGGSDYPFYVRTGTDQNLRIVNGGSDGLQIAAGTDGYIAYTKFQLGAGWLKFASTGAATFSSSTTADSLISNSTITSTGAIRSGGGTISSYWGTPGNVVNGGNTTFTYNQTSGEYAVGFMYSIVGLYAPSGTNILGVGQGYAYFFSDGSTNGTSTSAQIATGWSVSLSATNAGAYTITFTNNSGATMSNINYRIIKVNRVGAG
jgi:hypothetical protein